MKIKNLALLGAITLSIIPFAALADVSIVNNSNSPATAFAGASPCSNAAGERGVIKAHGHVEIPKWAVGLYCKPDCTAKVFMTKNCSGKSIASVAYNAHDGVRTIENNNVDGYRVEGEGNNLRIEGGPSRKWYQLFF